MDESLMHVEIYTDGACSGNPGPGGWAAILLYREREKPLAGGEPATTNNRMELTAAIEGLKLLNRPCSVTLYSDSSYMIDALSKGWLERWKLNQWKTTGKDDVKNKDLWEELVKLSAQHSIEWRKVKGHSDNEYNNRCDALARAEIKKLTVKAVGEPNQEAAGTGI
jgi:ribonuclease HI